MTSTESISVFVLNSSATYYVGFKKLSFLVLKCLSCLNVEQNCKPSNRLLLITSHALEREMVSDL